VDNVRLFEDSPDKKFDACFVLRVTTLKLPKARVVLIISVRRRVTSWRKLKAPCMKDKFHCLSFRLAPRFLYR
jgi:hypothetical protein